MSIHSRRAADEVIRLLAEHTTADRVLPILHWFSGSASDARKAVAQTALNCTPWHREALQRHCVIVASVRTTSRSSQNILGRRDAFPFPKSVYAARDAIAAVVRKAFRTARACLLEALGPLIELAEDTLPMSRGFEANLDYLRLGFVDPDARELGGRLNDLLPALWMMTGARGPIPAANRHRSSGLRDGDSPG